MAMRNLSCLRKRRHSVGYGDWLMATSQARKMHEANGIRVVVTGQNNRIHWSEVFENNPRLSRTNGSGTQRLVNAPGARPYIEAKTPLKWTWKRWDISPGE